MYYRKAKHDPSPVMKKARMELHSRTQHRTLANPLTKPAVRAQLKGVIRERKPILRDIRERKSVFRDGRIVLRERKPLLNLERVEPSSIYRYVRPGLKPVQKSAKTILKSSETGTQQAKETKEKAATREKPVKEETSASSGGSKKEMELLSVDSNQDGHYELNPLMTRMLETELQDIMIKVCQDLPEEALTEAEKLVSNKLQNEAAVDIKNALGMNITKRLLNVYNPLFVKVDFSKKPDTKSLKAFLRQFNCEKLMTNNVIKMKNIADFDVICNTKGLRCGNAKVYVVPYYKFTECPSKLKTIYNYVEAKKRRENEAENKKTAEAAEKDNVLLETIDNKEVEKNSQNAASVVKNDAIEPTGEKKPVQVKQVGKPEDSKSHVHTKSKTAVPRESNTILATATETVVSTEPKTAITTGTKTVSSTTTKTVTLTKPDVSTATKTVITAANKVVATTANKAVAPTRNKLVATKPNKEVATTANKPVATSANKVVATIPNKVVATTPNKVVATTPNKVVTTTANKPVPTSSNKVVASTPNKVVATTPNKVVATTANKPVATSPNKVVTTTANKPVATSANKVVATTANKVVATTANKVVTTTANKADATTANKAVVTTENKTGVSAVTETVHKATNASKDPQAQNEMNKTNKPSEGNTKTLKMVNDTKTVNKNRVEGKITKNDKINQILASDNKNDDDELDDEDILALISEGIVLDECSGSDGE